jgi:hypothetical protein
MKRAPMEFWGGVLRELQGTSGDTILICCISGVALSIVPLMARIARIVAPGMPHHITQRGNRRMETFGREGDYVTYLDLM